MIFPLPSSPHWAPTSTMFGMPVSPSAPGGNAAPPLRATAAARRHGQGTGT